MSIFNQVKMPGLQKSRFDLSHDVKLTLDMGQLVPTFCQEVLPGDTWKQSVQTLLRFMPMIAPVMHQVNIFQHFFFVPSRLCWDNWELFITGNSLNGDPPSGDVSKPFWSNVTFAEGSLGDYLGFPTGVSVTKVDALPFAAYGLIYDQYYRDENLVADVVGGAPVIQDDGDITTSGYNYLRNLYNRAWEHDYFTSCLPFAQKGDAVVVPTSFADVPVQLADPPSGLGPQVIRDSSYAAFGTSTLGTDSSGNFKGVTGTTSDAFLDPAGTLFAKTSDLAQTSTINDLRTAMATQQWLERNARGGTRYIEHILAHWGQRSSDARLQRPEYLGGSKQPAIISEVLQTGASISSGADASPQGNMAGHGISAGGGKQFSYHAEEHGWIIGIMSVMPRTSYQQGLQRQFNRFDVFDYATPEFANTGEQAVLAGEVYYSGTGGDGMDADTFGYVPRYAEYKYCPNRISGAFRSSLSYWHLGRIFSSRPALNANFVTSDPSKRIFAVEDPETNSLIAQVFHQVHVTRMLPYFGTPGLTKL